MDVVLDYKEDVLNYLSENNIELPEKLVDIIVEELGDKIQNHEANKTTTLSRESKTYEIYLVRSVNSVIKRFKGTQFDPDVLLEDDYSEESDADFHYQR